MYKGVGVVFPIVEIVREVAVTVVWGTLKCTLWKGGLSFDFSELMRMP